MVIDHAHITASSTQACLGVTLLPGGETIARYLEWEQSEYEWKKKWNKHLILSLKVVGKTASRLQKKDSSLSDSRNLVPRECFFPLSRQTHNRKFR